MLLTPKTPAKSLDPAYKLRPEREQIDRFKERFKTLFGHIDEKESEENIKDHLMDFLKAVYYRDSYVVAPKGKTDFVIHLGKDAASPAGVLFEVKRPANRSEMVSRENLNTKAFHELLLYYFQERSRDRNSDLRHCVVTNVYEWYIFDAALIDRVFYRNSWLKKEYNAWATGQKVSRNNDLFYNEIARPFLAALDEEIPFTYFDLRTYQKNVEDADPTNDRALLPLYKILSPAHLLKLPAATDSNRLNPRFYTELLHLIGLEEAKEGRSAAAGKKVIRRKAAGQRDEGSLLENAIIELDVSGKLSHVADPGQYGRTHEEQLFSVALELCITWVNRILFLKLLESQLVKYHRGDRAYAFLNRDTLADYDEVNRLFFRVLAKRPAERQGNVKQKFARVPYLNSSLFELTELEDSTLSINTLDSSLRLPLLRQSVLRDHPAYRDRAELPALEYLFAFLDAYDFASESGDDIQEKNRALINASVLGLIFEKINGYKDGSFYTPGFITEYMCRETIRRAVVQKFNDAHGWQCADFAALQDKDLDRATANDLINSLRICDPAVGSGHFLVSALNELIAIKSALRVLQDDAGRRLKGYLIRVVNDELVVLDEEDDEPFTYFLQEATGRPTAERQRVQRVLFHEKQILIENCLFGVDINPNSVKICRLRLWIELLKNAYYTEESHFAELETLPNIDINIKQGNSLLSKFSLTEDLSEVFRKQKFSLQTYRSAVAAYKGTADKDAKAELLRFIHDIKAQFRETVINRDPRRKRLSAKRGERILLDNNYDIFGKPIKDPKLVAMEKVRLDKLIAQIEAEIADVENNALYRGSFEWRFEFPEVLDEEGNYVGFDAVIGNPPYIRQEELGAAKAFLKKDFPNTFAGTADLYVMFVEHGLRILRPQGHFVYIIPNKWMRAGYGAALRRWLKGLAIEQIADFGDLPVFDEATTYPCIMMLRNAPATERFWATPVTTLDLPEGLGTYIAKHRFEVGTQSLQDDGWQLSGLAVQNLMAKLRATGKPLGEYVDGKIFYGIKTGLNEAFVIDAATRDRLIAEDPRSAEIIKPFLAGRDIKRYQTPEVSRYLIFTRRGIEIEKYPAILNYLTQFKERLIPKPKGWQGDWKGRKQGTYKWYEVQDAVDYYDEFEKPLIMYQEICTYQSFGWSDGGIYCNNKIFILPEANPALLALLNAKTTWFFLNQTTSKLMGNALAMQSPYIKAIPIPPIKKDSTLEILAKQILQAKSLDPAADTTALEAEIDQLVYALYGLTAEEIALVEG